MDIITLELLLKILGTLLSLYGASKITSELRSHRLTQGKLSAELVQELAEWAKAKDRPDIHPLVVQAKFHAAFGGYPYRLPDGREILDFLGNETQADLRNGREFAACLEFVAYSKLTEAFIPRAPWTMKKLRKERLGDFFLYLVCGLFFVYLATLPDLGPWRFTFAAPALLYAVLKGFQAGRVGRAERLLADAQ